ncbi:MAG: YncE family protein [Prevotella sp.]|nr:YncE family protein [Prevotella sp.]
MNIVKKAIFIIIIFLMGLLPSMSQDLIIHPSLGLSVISADSSLSIKLINKKQGFYYTDSLTWDADINSPKSVNIHPNGRKFYVNSLEGGATVCYDFITGKKISVIRHDFQEGRDDSLWAKPSGLYPWRHYSRNLNTFMGKPVESTFSHKGRFLWVPYYRRSFDINAQDPSAVAVIDTETNRIVRMMETGPLPKMIATSPDGSMIAISHWGNNTVGLIDVSSENPKFWKHIMVLAIDKELPLNFPLDKSVDRDNNSGYALRGTVFTPDGNFLFVGCMGGGGGIAVIDITHKRYLGRILGMLPNVRHLVISGDYLYLSINGRGVIQRIRWRDLLEKALHMEGHSAVIKGWELCNVGRGARTICLSPDGHYVFAACNNASKLYAVDTRSMKVIANIDVDSYPVGLDISADGRYLITTSQGRKNGGGNAVDIFEVTYVVSPNSTANVKSQEIEQDSTSMSSSASSTTPPGNHILFYGTLLIIVCLLLGVLGWRFSKKHRKFTLLI